MTHVSVINSEEDRKRKKRRSDLIEKLVMSFLGAGVASLPILILLLFKWLFGPAEGTASSIIAAAGIITFGVFQMIFVIVFLVFLLWLWSQT